MGRSSAASVPLRGGAGGRVDGQDHAQQVTERVREPPVGQLVTGPAAVRHGHHQRPRPAGRPRPPWRQGLPPGLGAGGLAGDLADGGAVRGLLLRQRLGEAALLARWARSRPGAAGPGGRLAAG